ncbi:MAG: cupin domain-containing protein [Rubrivivax sp.]|jgi:anti-sigma factor ChrR (cupin superfamily)|nr:cupin domain-containing protein [Rubrivivax sp.]
MTRHPEDPTEQRDEPVLDADVLALLDEGLAPVPLDAQAQARIKKQLLRRIASDTLSEHTTVAPGDQGWAPFGKGLTIKRLHEADGVLSCLVRLAPGAVLPAHRHPVDEECVVLEGEMQIGDIRLGPGGFHLGRRGVLHDRLRSGDAGALIYLRGAVPEAALNL